MGSGRKLRVKITILFLIGIVSGVKSQTSSLLDLQEKYWNYRERFKKTHINIGRLEGNTLPITNRYNYSIASANNTHRCEPCHPPSDSKVMLEWSDNALIDLGKYVAVLSTEINLLIQNHQDYSEPMRELYYALLTYRRLDKMSDQYLDPDLAENEDGRLMRDDVRLTSANNWVGFDSSAYVNAKAAATFKQYRHVMYQDPPVAICSSRTYNVLNIMSKDDVIGILFGLAFVKKYVPNDFVTDESGQNGIYIVTEAQNIAHRIMNHISLPQEYPRECGLFNWAVTMRENWTILYPEIDHEGYYTINQQDGVFGVDFFNEIAPAIVALGNYITGHTYSYIKIKDRNLIPSSSILNENCQDYQSTKDPSSRYSHIIRILRYDGPLIGHIFNASPLGLIILRSPEAALVSAHINVQAGLVGPMSTYNAHKITKRFRTEHLYDLAIAQFRNVTPSNPKTFWEHILLDAPKCENIGSYNGPSNWNNDYFGRDLYGPDHHDYEGERAGLDYMLLYNLYHLQYGTIDTYSKSACDCKASSILFNSPTIVNSNTNISKGKTNIQSAPTYLANGISIESFIITPVQIQSNANLEILEFVSLCTQMNESSNSLHNSGTLQIGNVSDQGRLSFKQNTQLINQSGGQIVVKSGSELIISRAGLLDNQQGATIQLESGAKLIIENGAEMILSGSLDIASDAKIIIHNGGRLIVQPSGIISSSSSSPSIHLSGKIEINGNLFADDFGLLEFSRRFNEHPEIIVNNGAEFKLPTGSSSTIRIVGLNAADLTIRTVGSGAINFLGGKVVLSENSRVFVNGNSYFSNTHFVSSVTSGIRTNGVVVTPTNAFNIQLCTFNGLGKALSLNLSLSTNIATINNSHFSNHFNGLYVSNKGLLLKNSTFTNISDVAILTEGINMPSKIELTTISYSSTGTGILNQGASYQGLLNVEKCTLSNLMTGIENDLGRILVKESNLISNEIGIHIEVGTVEATCSNLDQNVIAVAIGEFGRFKTNYGSKNSISNNDIGINVYGGNILLNGGENLFENNILDFYGEVKPSSSLLPLNVGYNAGTYNFYQFNITRNIFTTYYYPTVINNNLYDTYGSSPILYVPYFSINPNQSISIPNATDIRDVYPLCINCNISYVPCPTGGITEAPYSHIEDLLPGSGNTNFYVDNLHFANVELKEAIRIAANNISLDLESPNNDSLAIVLLSSIISSPELLSDEDSKQLLMYCHQLMTTALSNAYNLGVLPVTYEGIPLPLNSYTEDLINSIEEYVSSLNPSEDDLEIANRLLDIALLYRISGHYESALDYLNDERIGALSLAIKEYWHCIVENEWNFILGNISIDDFMNAAEECSGNMHLRKQHLNISEILAKVNRDIQEKDGAKLFPNPTSNFTTVLLNNPRLSIESVSVFNLQGVLVRNYGKISSASVRSVELDLSDLSNGIYVIRTTDVQGKCYNLKLIKQAQ